VDSPSICQGQVGRNEIFRIQGIDSGLLTRISLPRSFSNALRVGTTIVIVFSPALGSIIDDISHKTAILTLAITTMIIVAIDSGVGEFFNEAQVQLTLAITTTIMLAIDSGVGEFFNEAQVQLTLAITTMIIAAIDIGVGEFCKEATQVTLPITTVIIVAFKIGVGELFKEAGQVLTLD